MEAIILAVAIGLGFAFFATQNTQGVSLFLLNYSWKHIPLYFVIVGSLLLGLILAWILSIIQALSSFFSLHKKDEKIKEANKTISELTKRVHALELENGNHNSKNSKDVEDEKTL